MWPKLKDFATTVLLSAGVLILLGVIAKVASYPFLWGYGLLP